MVWDVEIPEYTGGKKDVFVIPLTIYLQNTRIETAYGVMWPGRKQNLQKLVSLKK